MRTDLRTRLALLAAATSAVMCFSDPRWLAGLIVLEMVVLAALGISLAGIGRFLRPMLILMGFVWVVTVFVAPVRFLEDPDLGRVLASWGPLEATVGGVVAGAMFTERMVAMVMATWAVLVEADVDEVLELANHWRAPAAVTTVLTCAVATIPRLAARREQIAQAQASRGASRGGPVRSWTHAVSLMVPLMVTCVTTAQDMAVALSMRGHGAAHRLTVMADLSWRVRDRVVAWCALVFCLVVPIARVWLGWGSVLPSA